MPLADLAVAQHDPRPPQAASDASHLTHTWHRPLCHPTDTYLTSSPVSPPQLATVREELLSYRSTGEAMLEAKDEELLAALRKNAGLADELMGVRAMLAAAQQTLQEMQQQAATVPELPRTPAGQQAGAAGDESDDEPYFEVAEVGRRWECSWAGACVVDLLAVLWHLECCIRP
jgi:hypothetical protein